MQTNEIGLRRGDRLATSQGDRIRPSRADNAFPPPLAPRGEVIPPMPWADWRAVVRRATRGAHAFSLFAPGADGARGA